MKMHNIEDIDSMTDSEQEQVLSQRAKKFIATLSSSLKGESVESFGKNSRGIWGESKDTLSFKIKNVTLQSDLVDIYEEKAMLNINISLVDYDDSKKYGMLYTDSKSEKSINNLITSLLGKDVKAGWSEQGLQGDKYINLDLSLPAKMIAPDFLIYHKYQKQLKSIKEKANSKISSIKIK